MRVKRGVVSRRRHKKMLKRAEGFRGRSKNVYKVAKTRVEKALVYAYRDRKVNKRTFRSLWITRINAACRIEGTTYGKFIAGLKLAKIEIDRKVLSDMAHRYPEMFKAVVATVKSAAARA